MHDPQPLVTVCIPAYNAGKTIGNTLDSILSQDYPNIEIVVCDNLSKDNTAEIVKSYEKDGVKYYLNSKVDLPEGNWNCALELTTGDFIALFHADDLYMTSMVSRQVSFLINNPDVSAVFTMSALINDEGKTLRSKLETVSALPEFGNEKNIFDFPTIFNAILKYSNFIKTPTLMARKETFSAVGKFDLEYKTSADLELWLRMSQYKPIGIINEPLHKYRISSTQGSATMMKGRTELPDFFNVIEKYFKKNIQLVTQESLGYYQMFKGSELILCSMNLMLNYENLRAKASLKQALLFRNFKYALGRKRIFIRYVIGYFFLLAIYLRIGNIVANLVNLAYVKDQKKWNQPIESASGSI